MAEFELGQKVSYRRTLHRAMLGNRRVWESYKWTDPFTDQPDLNGVGIVVGMKTLSNGTVSGFEYNEYTRTESFQAVEIAHSLRRKHVLVRPEHVTPVPDPNDPRSGNA